MSVPTRILLITGMSGAGKSTALKTLEDLGWETDDNLPLSLLDRLLATPGGRSSDADARPLAIGIDSRTRAFDAEAIVGRINSLRIDEGMEIEIGRAHVRTPVTNAHLVYRLLLENKKQNNYNTKKPSVNTLTITPDNK